MSFIDSFYYLFGAKRPKPGSTAGLAHEQQCPHEAEILTYSEGKLSRNRRVQLESHFVSCDNCRDLLVLLAQFSEEMLAKPAPISEEAVKKQAARVLAYIENDEKNRKALTSEPAGQELTRKRETGFFVSYRQLATAALVICSICAAGIYLMTSGQNPAQIASYHIAKTMQSERRSELRISGDFDHSPYIATRGEKDGDVLELKQAVIKLKSAESETAPAEARRNLARVYLAFETPDRAAQALKILESLAVAGVNSAEVLNDLGVALFQLGSFEKSIESFDKALAEKPNYSEALFNKALAEKRAGRNEDARRDFLVFINQSSDPKWIAEAQRNLSLLPASQNQ